MSEPILPLTKEDVAQRALDAAIDIHLDGGDPVAVHLLAYSAIHVLRGVAISKNIPTPYLAHHDSPGMGKVFRDRFDESYLFMKHARNDPDDVLKNFMPSANFLVLAVAAGEFAAVFERETRGMSAFKAWLQVEYPDLSSW